MKEISGKLFETRDWLRVNTSDLGPAANVPTMISYSQSNFYYWICKQLAGSDGEVVDLGCYAGGSTARLAQGHKVGGGTTKVHAFDRFGTTEQAKENHLTSQGIPYFEGEDIFQLSKELLSPWEDIVEFHKGEIEDQVWEGEPISVLVVDAAKNTVSTDFIASMFYPSMLPNCSVLIHQDEVFKRQPWLLAQMQLLEDYFEPITYLPGTAIVYVLRDWLSRKAIANAEVARLTDDQMIGLMEASKKRLSAFSVDHLIDLSIETLKLNPKVRRASGFVNSAEVGE